MKKPPLELRHRTSILAVTFLAFNLEWWLFELLRAPYRPPDDMSTMLGRGEIQLVILLIAAIAIAWPSYVARNASQFTLNRMEVVGFTAFCLALLLAATFIIRYPTWPVTPLEMFATSLFG